MTLKLMVIDGRGNVKGSVWLETFFLVRLFGSCGGFIPNGVYRGSTSASDLVTDTNSCVNGMF